MSSFSFWTARSTDLSPAMPVVTPDPGPDDCAVPTEFVPTGGAVNAEELPVALGLLPELFTPALLAGPKDAPLPADEPVPTEPAVATVPEFPTVLELPAEAPLAPALAPADAPPLPTTGAPGATASTSLGKRERRAGENDGSND